MAAPSTSKIFPMMEPAIDAFTMSWSPACKAVSAIISSAAFPKVAFKSPPIASPSPSASSSVARPIHQANARIEREEAIKIRRYRSGASSSRPTAAGMKSRSQFIIAIDTFPATSRAIHNARAVLARILYELRGQRQKLRGAYRALSASWVILLRACFEWSNECPYGVRRTNHAEI